MKRQLISCRRAIALLCAVCVLLIALPAGIAERGAGTVTGAYANSGHRITREYAYSEDFFRPPSDEYHMDLARLSMGLALAAFRAEDKPEAQDADLIAFFEEMGFEDIETETYRTEPTTDSIGYGIAQLKLDDMTVVAVGVCGGGYGAEWASNLTVGDDVRSEGFQDASQKLQAALKDYMDRHPAEGDVKLWIAGYSRAAAVSNITAADCTDCGLFTDVYAYTFATPRTTREPGDYRNIFNILQKNDVVPKVPLADWGYKRYGKDLFLVSAEIDIDRADVIERAKQVYRDMVGSEMVMNFEINNELRVLVDYLYMLVPEPASYVAYLQPVILDIMTASDGTEDALIVLLKALQNYSEEDTQHGEELKAMRDYLGTLISVYYLRDGISRLPAEQWDQELGTLNLFNEHLPFEYMALMYASDDPDEIFSDNTRYVRLVIYGKTDATIMDGDKVLKEVLADGTELVDGVKAPYSLPDVECSEDKTVITLPADRSFTISITSRAALPQTVTYTGLMYSGDTVRAESDDLYSFLMNSGEKAVIVTSSGGKAIEPDSSSHTDVSAYISAIYSPTTAMRLENNDVMHLTISGLVNKLLLIIVVLLVSMIASIVLSVIRVKKHRRKNAAVAFVWHAVMVLMFAILELAMWYFIPILTLAKLIPAIVVFLVIAMYAHKGYRRYGMGLVPCLVIVIALAIFQILGSMLLGDFAIWKCVLTLVVYALFMAVSYILLWGDRVADRPVS